MAADGKRKTTGALGVVLALALTVVVAGGAAYGAYAAASAQPGIGDDLKKLGLFNIDGVTGGEKPAAPAVQTGEAPSPAPIPSEDAAENGYNYKEVLYDEDGLLVARIVGKRWSGYIAVIDDPESIIRCTNKVYLSELFEKARIPAPASQLLFRSNEYTYEEISERLGSPFILKIPDGSFSVGMHKVADQDELRTALDEMFGHSSVVLAQEFTPTEFDWRIGILDGEPLFACKYFMAKGHWQIYNHAVTGKNLCGPWETIPVYKVPAKVRETALKAAALIGKGLYGVDLKVVDGRPVVIEINDNPSIDHEVEDEVLGDELYYRIVNYFINKLSRMHV